MRGEASIEYQKMRESMSNVVSGTSTLIRIDNQSAIKSWNTFGTPVTHARQWGTPKWLTIEHATKR